MALYAILAAVLFVNTPQATLAADQPTDKARATFFNQHVLPIFKQHCYKCHSHSAKKVKGGLVLDSRSGWVKGGDSGPVVIPGKPDQSLLIRCCPLCRQ